MENKRYYSIQYIPGLSGILTVYTLNNTLSLWQILKLLPEVIAFHFILLI